MRKSADLKKLDKKHISPETLGMLITGRPDLLRQAVNRADLQFLKAQARERRRQIFDAIKYPDFYRKPPEQRPTPEPNMSQFLPQSPGLPQAPGGPASPQGMMVSSSLRDFVMTKISEEESQSEHDVEEDQGAESPEEERAEQMDPDIVQQLVNLIVEKGDAIDDEKDFHAKTKELGVNTHEAEEQIYKLLATLVGGKNDIIPGGLSAGMPTSDFPADQLAKGREVEVEHSSNPVIATEISKDHLVEGEDYYKPRLADLEKGMDKAKEDDKIVGINEDTAKGKKNVDRKDKDAEKMKEMGRKEAFKYGFFMKLAQSGMKPSEFEQIFRYSIEKSADLSGVAGGLAGGAVLSKLLDLMGTGIKGGWRAITGAGKLGLMAPLLLAPILGGVAGGSLYYMTRPQEMTAEDIKQMEQIALYRRLARRARRRTRKEEGEGAGDKTRPDDAHRKILPMAATPTVEV